VGRFAWSRMMTSVGQMMQYANEEFRRAKQCHSDERGVTAKAAFA
jgi:hypothetical protein